MGPEDSRGWSICAPRSRSMRNAGRSSFTSKCRLPLVHSAGASETGPQDPFGRHYGEPAWQDIPGELSRMCAADRHPGDTAGSVGSSAISARPPSLYDLPRVSGQRRGRPEPLAMSICCRNISARGREEAAELLQRRSGDADKPRHAGRVQRSDAGLAVVSHVHVLHRS